MYSLIHNARRGISRYSPPLLGASLPFVTRSTITHSNIIYYTSVVAPELASTRLSASRYQHFHTAGPRLFPRRRGKPHSHSPYQSLIEPAAEWCKQQGIRMIHHPPDKSGKKSIPLSHQDVKFATETILDSTNSPVHVHCLNGSEATGLDMACLRNLQFWATPCIFSELQRFSELHNSFEAFLEGFGEEIEIPEQAVGWFWQKMKDADGVIGRHRVGIRYKDKDLQGKRLRRLAVEEESRMSGVEVNGAGGEGDSRP